MTARSGEQVTVVVSTSARCRARVAVVRPRGTGAPVVAARISGEHPAPRSPAAGARADAPQRGQPGAVLVLVDLPAGEPVGEQALGRPLPGCVGGPGGAVPRAPDGADHQPDDEPNQPEEQQ